MLKVQPSCKGFSPNTDEKCLKKRTDSKAKSLPLSVSQASAIILFKPE